MPVDCIERPGGGYGLSRSPALDWNRERLRLLDQRRLPAELRYLECRTASDVAVAIRDMVIRGAPAIGIAAAYGIALAVREHGRLEEVQRRQALDQEFDRLAEARPTAVNLVWALNRMRSLVEQGANFDAVAAAAEALHDEDIKTNAMLARLGSERLGENVRVLTHCNTGPLATGGIGTAFGVIASAWRAGKVASVHFTETRPWMQGARLTAWELSQAAVPATLVTESAAAGMALAGAFDWLVVGADRIAVNGDVVNKTGTAPLSVLVRRGGGRVMVVAPHATFDPDMKDGGDVVIEQRPGAELGVETLPEGIRVANPAFDVTPATEVDLLVTERGVIAPAQGECTGCPEQSGMIK